MRSPKRLVTATLALLLALILTGVAVSTFTARVDPRAISQRRLYELGTSAGRIEMRPLPSLHRVIIAPVAPSDVVRALRTSFSMRATVRDRVQGYYDPNTKAIRIVGVLPRLEASTNTPWAQPHFRRALRHEYGHAFLDDWASSHLDASGRSPDFSVDRSSAHADDFPPRLRRVVAEYSGVGPWVFGFDYYASSFAEYVAEGYARYLEGRSLPPQLRSLLDDASVHTPKRRTSR